MNERRNNPPSALAVWLQGRRVGIITHLAGDRHLFAFDEDYVEDPARPTLSLSFKSRSGGLVTDVRPYTARLPPFFSNLLPEGHLRDYLATRAGVKPEREFPLLTALGSDLPGAVTVAPADEAGHGDDARDATGDSPLDETSPLRFSLAGVQLKFSAVMEATGGLTVPADGIGGSWIVKLPSTRFAAVPENEFVMMELARRVGIEVPTLRMVSVRDIKGIPAEASELPGNALAVQRFDRRPDGARVHMEDFAQIFGVFPQDKYEKRSYANIAAVLGAETGPDGVNEFMRRLVFSVLVGNADMHLKNWSLIYPDDKSPVLSPAYDLVSTIPYLPNDRLALGFGGTKRIDAVAPEQVRRFADVGRLAVNPLWRIVEETVERTVEAWRSHDPGVLLPGDILAAIDRHLDRVANRIMEAAE